MFCDYLEVLNLAVIVVFNFVRDRIRHVYFVVDQFWKRRQRAIMTNAILSGECIANECFTKLLKTTLDNSSLQESLESLIVGNSSITSVGAGSSIRKRVRMIILHFPSERFIKILTSSREKLKKSDDVANNLIKRANFYMRNHALTLALRSYNLAICFTTGDSRQVGRIFLERHALLVEMSRNLKSVVQIESTTSCTHSVANGSRKHPQKFVSNDSDMEFQEYRDFYEKIEEFREEVMFSLHGERNKRIPSAADYVKMVSNAKKGRHLIVTQHLPPGTTVIVEEPYTTTLNYSTSWQAKHCSTCFRRILNGVPCHGCVFALYCSELCRSQDFKNGHKYECGCMSYAHAIKLAPELHLGFKAICKAGPNTLYKLYKASKEQKSCRARKLLKGFDPSTGRYDSDSYYQMLHLTSHEDPWTINSLTYLTVSIIKVLELETTFFDQVEGAEKSSFFEFVAVALLRHFTSFQFNSFILSALAQNDTHTFNDNDSPLDQIQTMKIATGGYSLLSMMNHSCHPTVICKNLRNGKVAVITNRRLIPGDELLFSYGCEFGTSPRSMRRSRLFESHRFRCDCDPCSYNWPLLRDIKLTRRFVCPDCSPKFRQSQLMEIGKCVLNNGSNAGVLVCRNCGQTFNEQRLLAEVEHFVHIFERTRQLVADGEILQAIPLLLVCVDYFQKILCPPARDFMNVQKLLDMAFGLVVHSWLNKL